MRDAEPRRPSVSDRREPAAGARGGRRDDDDARAVRRPRGLRGRCVARDVAAPAPVGTLRGTGGRTRTRARRGDRLPVRRLTTGRSRRRARRARRLLAGITATPVRARPLEDDARAVGRESGRRPSAPGTLVAAPPWRRRSSAGARRRLSRRAKTRSASVRRPGRIDVACRGRDRACTARVASVRRGCRRPCAARLAKATRVPSGETAGIAASRPRAVSVRAAPLPSAFS